MATKVDTPSDVYTNAWDSEYQYKLYLVSHDKKFMVTKRQGEILINDLLKTVDGVQASFLDVNNGAIPYGKYYKLGRGFQGRTTSDIESLAQSLYSGTRRDTGIMAQIQEDCQCNTGFSEITEKVLERLFALQVANEPGTTIDNSEIIGDYFMENYGWGDGGGFTGRNQTLGNLALSSSAEAQKVIYHDPAPENGYTTNEQGYYYRFGGYNYRHRMAGGYFDGIGRQILGAYVYDQVFELERHYVAMSNRKVATFAWCSFEGVNAAVEKEGGSNALPIASPSGKLYRAGLFREASFESAKTHSLIGLLLGDRYYMWHDGSPYGLESKCFGLPYENNLNPSQTTWEATGQGAVQWDESNPTHPHRDCTNAVTPSWSNGKVSFSVKATPNMNGSWAGHYIYGQIYKYCNGSLKYPTFSYVEKGVSKTGYVGGNDPQTGILGAEVSRFGKGNSGQHNIVDAWYNQKAFAFHGTGLEDSNKQVIIVKNIYAGIKGITTYTFPNIKGGTTITHRGNSIGTYIV